MWFKPKARTATGWDTSYPQIVPANGYLTSGAPLTNSAVNTRSLRNKLGATSYFTKFAGTGDTSLQVTKVSLSAYRKDDNTVHVYWNTNPEINIRHFVVERSLSNESSFVGRDSLVSRVEYVVIWNEAGQMLHRELANDRSVIPMHVELPGTYSVGFISQGGQLLQTKKLLVTGN